ncbi:MAG: efflux RND transporter periplasmic adaptor subunit [Gammaproteobacteria bacterium]|nr:efflux RND transporter periplasmic adaptor subunit [Gammaproteobacteria bacterium]
MKVLKNLLLLVIGAVIGIAVIKYISPDLLSTMVSTEMGADVTQADKEKPLYWVAPMNPRFYKRDKPGKSPMGMDLIPVYADNSSGADEGPGTIRISPDIVNNLGVRTTTVVREPLQTGIKTVGYVQYDEDKLIHVHPRVEGWVEKLYVKASGDPVKRGQPLYTLYSPNLVNAQEEYLIALQRKNERLICAAEARLKSLEISAGFIRNLKKNRQVKQSVTFYAPRSGVIAMLNIREGFFVKPDTTMLSIGVLDEVWVQAEIFERQAGQVKVGLPVTMTLDYVPSREWQGKVDYIYPTLEASTRTLRVRLRFANKDRVLMPNMFTQITIHADKAQAVLLLPREAVIRTGDMDRVVLALGDGAFKAVQVKTGNSDDKNIEIVEGVSEGEKVVTSAQFLLDSESSKTSDFRRLNHGMTMEMNDGEDDDMSAEVEGVINSIMLEHRMINISREAIPKWNRDAATLDFLVDKEVDIAHLEKRNKNSFYI